MAKLSSIEKKLYKTLKAQALDAGAVFGVWAGVGIVAFFPTCRGRGYMVYSLCSSDDIWNKKRGKFEALARWYDLDFSGLPVFMPENKAEADVIAEALLSVIA